MLNRRQRIVRQRQLERSLRAAIRRCDAKLTALKLRSLELRAALYNEEIKSLEDLASLTDAKATGSAT